MLFYEADFETTTSVFSTKKSQVWLYYIENILDENDNNIGVSIDGFFNFLNDFKKSAWVYFHNLNWDGEFLLNWLVSNANYKVPVFQEKRTKLENNEFTNMSDGVSSHYFIRWKNSWGAIINFKCSLKMLRASVSSLLNLEEKTKIDYDIVNLYKHISEVPEDVIKYIKLDVKAVIPYMKNILSIWSKPGLTLSGAGLKDIKKRTKDFDLFFKDKIKTGKIDEKGEWHKGEWDELYKFFRGGFSYLMPGKENKLCFNIRSLDFNSIYPKIMRDFKLPISFPFYNCGKNCIHKLQLLEIELSYELKKNGIPSIPKTGLSKSDEHIEYGISAENETIFITNIEWESIVKDNYVITKSKVIKKICFQNREMLFKDFFDYWQDVKQKSNSGEPDYQLSKGVQNSQYGKFAQKYMRKRYFLRKFDPLKDNRKGIIKYGLDEDKWVFDYFWEANKGSYLPMAIFITAYARTMLIKLNSLTNICSHLPNSGFIYSDTDSSHFSACDVCWEKIKVSVNNYFGIDDKELGCLKLELKEFGYLCKFGMYFRRKTYVEFNDLNSNERNVGWSGVDKNELKCYTNKEIVSGKFKLYKKQRVKVNGGVLLIRKEVKMKG